jgi:NADH:ubiquinone oxidoreductase subunit 2 (subunit N)
MLIEINLIAFIPIILKLQTPSEREISIKYFIPQSIGSIIIILTILIINSMPEFNFSYFYTFILLGVIIKIGIIPFHFWYISVLNSLKYTPIFILIT